MDVEGSIFPVETSFERINIGGDIGERGEEVRRATREIAEVAAILGTEHVS